LALRIPVRLRHLDREVEAPALLNTGFETDVPVVALPLQVALELGLRVGERRMYFGPGRLIGEAFLAGKLTVVVESGGVSRAIEAHALVEPGESEVVLSDTCIAELGIVVDLKRGAWWLA